MKLSNEALLQYAVSIYFFITLRAVLSDLYVGIDQVEIGRSERLGYEWSGAIHGGFKRERSFDIVVGLAA